MKKKADSKDIELYNALNESIQELVEHHGTSLNVSLNKIKEADTGNEVRFVAIEKDGEIEIRNFISKDGSEYSWCMDMWNVYRMLSELCSYTGLKLKKEWSISSSETHVYPKKEKGGIDMFTYVGNDNLRPAMKGVYLNDGFAVATDAYVMVWKRFDYPESDEGIIIFDKGIRSQETKYPKWKGVIPETDLEFSIDVKEFERISKIALVKLKEKKRVNKYYDDYAHVRITIPDSDVSIFLNGKMVIKKLIPFLKATKCSTVSIKSESFCISDDGIKCYKEGVIFNSPDGNSHLMIMPIIPEKTYEVKEIIHLDNIKKEEIDEPLF